MTRLQIAGVAFSVLLAGSLGACKTDEAKAVDTVKIVAAVKADEAQLIDDFNAHDAGKVVGHDAPDVVQMAHGGPNAVGPAADLALNKALFAADPTQHFAVAAESVDVAKSGDLAIYRSTYTYDLADPKTKTPEVETGNYVAGYKPRADGSWKIAWSILADIETNPPKR